MRKFFAVAMGSVAALVGFAGTANASATVDLIWIDVTNVDTAGNPICLEPANRDCPELGVTLTYMSVTDTITLGLIITAGPGGVVGAGVSVDYSNMLPTFSVNGFQRLTTPGWLTYTLGVTSDIPPFINNFSAFRWYAPAGFGIGMQPGQTAYLGTVSFHKDQLQYGTFEVEVGTFGPGGTDGIGDLAGQNISSTTTFNKAFVVDLEPIPTPAPDFDGDGVEDALDNCSERANPSQDDTDGDFCGNVCDGDYDQTGVSGFADWPVFVAAFGSTDEEKVHRDPVSGQTVGYRDFGFWVRSFNTVPGPSGTTPGTLACPL